MGWVGKNSAQGFSEMYNKVLDIFGDKNFKLSALRFSLDGKRFFFHGNHVISLLELFLNDR